MHDASDINKVFPLLAYLQGMVQLCSAQNIVLTLGEMLFRTKWVFWCRWWGEVLVIQHISQHELIFIIWNSWRAQFFIACHSVIHSHPRVWISMPLNGDVSIPSLQRSKWVAACVLIRLAFMKLLCTLTGSNSLCESHDLWIVSKNLSFSLIKYLNFSISSQHCCPSKSVFSWLIDVHAKLYVRIHLELANLHCYLLSLGEHFFLRFRMNKSISSPGPEMEIMLHMNLFTFALFYLWKRPLAAAEESPQIALVQPSILLNLCKGYPEL